MKCIPTNPKTKQPLGDDFADANHLIAGWPGEDNTTAVVGRRLRLTGISADKVLDFERAEHLRPVLLAMIRIENGRQPCPDSIIDEALARAGVTRQAEEWTTLN